MECELQRSVARELTEVFFVVNALVADTMTLFLLS